MKLTANALNFMVSKERYRRSSQLRFEVAWGGARGVKSVFQLPEFVRIEYFFLILAAEFSIFFKIDNSSGWSIF